MASASRYPKSRRSKPHNTSRTAGSTCAKLASSATLEVRYITHTESRLNKPISGTIGCQFINLSPANETLIQRFMAKIEVERRALSAG